MSILVGCKEKHEYKNMRSNQNVVCGRELEHGVSQPSGESDEYHMRNLKVFNIIFRQR